MTRSRTLNTVPVTLSTYVSCASPFNEEGHNRDSLYGQCARIAESADVMALFDEALRGQGFAGDTANARLLYHALTTRLGQDDLVSIVVQGPPSSGKSFLVNKVLGFFPPEAYEVASDMSPTALSRWDVDLCHKFLVIQERAGIGGVNGNPHLRTLMTEGRLSRRVTEATSDGFRVVELEREGPTGVITTTADVRIHDEDVTRFLRINLEARREDIRHGMDATAQRYAGTFVRSLHEPLDEWIAFQRWVAADGRKVTVNFAPELASLIPETAARLNRDLPKVLSLVCASARLHACHREENADGEIVASLEDYGHVLPLVARIVSESAEATVPDHVRRVADAVKRHVAARSRGANNREVEALLGGAPRSSVSRWIEEACELGYLVNREPNRGRPSCLFPGYELPEEGTILLPTVDELREAIGH